MTTKKKGASATLREVQAMLKGTCQSITRTDGATLREDPEHGPYTLVTDRRGVLGQTGTLDELLVSIRSGHYIQGGPMTYWEAMTVADLLEELKGLPLTARIHLLSRPTPMFGGPVGAHSKKAMGKATGLPLVSLETDNLDNATKVKNIYLRPGKAK